MIRIALFIGLSAACAACSFLVDTSGLGGPDVPPGDASTDAPSLPADGGDARNDAGGADADAGPPACGAFFCDEFERPGDDLLGGWTKGLTNAGGTLAIAPGEGPNGSSALRIGLPSSGAESVRANLEKSVGIAKNVRLSFALRADPATVREVHLAEVTADADSRGVFLFFAPDGQFKAAFQTYGDGGRYYDRVLPAFEPGVWHRYDIDVTPASVPRAIVRIDGVPVVDEELSFPIESVSRVDLGSSFTRAGAAVEVFYDDVRVDVAK